jgi:hypothetical protein
VLLKRPLSRSICQRMSTAIFIKRGEKKNLLNEFLRKKVKETGLALRSRLRLK